MKSIDYKEIAVHYYLVEEKLLEGVCSKEQYTKNQELLI